MKTKNLIMSLLLFGGMLFTSGAIAQISYTFTNNSPQTVSVAVLSIYDDCTTSPCSDGPVTVPSGGTHTFTGCSTGAWKELRVVDGCGGAQVGVCLSTSTSTVVNLCSGSYTLTYIDENNGDLN